MRSKFRETEKQSQQRSKFQQSAVAEKSVLMTLTFVTKIKSSKSRFPI